MNNKSLLILKLVMLILIFIMVLFFAFNMINKNTTTQFGEVINITTNTEQLAGQTFTNVNKIVINTVAMDVRVMESDVQEVTVIDNSKGFGLRFGENNTTIQSGDILTFKEGKRISFFGGTFGKVYIQVPKGTVIEYEIKSVSGDIVHSAPSKNHLKLETVSGSIRALVAGDRLTANSISGSIRSFAPFKTASGKSVSGSIRLSATDISQEITVNSTSGSIRVMLENVNGYNMDYSNISGSVTDCYKDVSYSKSGTVKDGEGSLKLKIKSISGSIRLTDWE